MIYYDTWALIYEIQIEMLLNSISYSIAYKFEEEICVWYWQSLWFYPGDIVFKKGIPALRWQTVTKSEEVFD